MLRVLRRPRWIAYLLLAVLFGVLATGLGLWQWGRYEDKAQRRDLVAIPMTDVPLHQRNLHIQTFDGRVLPASVERFMQTFIRHLDVLYPEESPVA